MMDIIGAAEAGRLLGVSRQRVNQLVRSGRLQPVLRIGPLRACGFSREDVERLRQEREQWWPRKRREINRLDTRVTTQRLAVAQVLANAKDHPTAREVYERAKAHSPHITLATVYNAVKALVRSGVTQPLPSPNGTRYDGQLSPHANLVCIQCGSIVDEFDEEGIVSRLREQAVSRNGFRVISQWVDFYGLCPQCATEAPCQ